MRIAFDANPLVSAKSGVGFFTHELIQSLADNSDQSIRLVGYYFNFLGRKQPHDLPVSPKISYRQSRLIPGKVLSACRKLGFQLPLEFFTKQRSDIGLFPNFVSLPTLTKSLKIVVIYDLSFIDCPEYVSQKNGNFLRRWAPGSIKKADMIIVNSNFIKNRVAQVYQIPEHKIHVAPIPPRPSAQPDYSIINAHNLDNGFLLFVGTIEPRKNIPALLEAYSKIPKEIQDRHPLVLTGGKGWNDAAILRQIDRLKDEGIRIIQTGYISEAEKSALYEKSTLCVQPSHYEGFGMPILEAMSFAKPVACSNLEVFHEVAGDAATYFDQDKPKEIAKVIESLLTDKNKLSVLINKSTQRINDFPSWSQVAVDLLDHIKQLDR